MDFKFTHSLGKISCQDFPLKNIFLFFPTVRHDL